jgi:uncharacterized protein (DUF433 family)
MPAQSPLKAIYKNGLLYPMQSLALAEDQVVELTVNLEGVSETLTEHLYITQTPGICGGSAIIKGTRIPVRVLVKYYQMGYGVDEILEGYPHLTRAQFFDALSYYYDHQAEIEAEQADNELSSVAQRFHLEVTPDGVLMPKAES